MGERTGLVVVCLILILALSCPTVNASHGLSWGIEVGDRFNYHYSISHTDPTQNVALEYYVIVDNLPTISENISELQEVSASSANEWNSYFSFYFMNDTEITPVTEVYTLHWSVYPIGNWTCVKESFFSDYNTTYWSAQLIDTETEWGITITGEDPLALRTETVKYSKEDGALNLLEMNWQYTSGNFRLQRYTRVTGGVPLEIIIGVASISIGVVILGIVIVRRRSIST
jgi:hypothetical protein